MFPQRTWIPPTLNGTRSSRFKGLQPGAVVDGHLSRPLANSGRAADRCPKTVLVALGLLNDPKVFYRRSPVPHVARRRPLPRSPIVKLVCFYDALCDDDIAPTPYLRGRTILYYYRLFTHDAAPYYKARVYVFTFFVLLPFAYVVVVVVVVCPETRHGDIRYKRVARTR